MDSRTRPGTPLRQHMIDGMRGHMRRRMRMRKMAEHTQDGKVRAVRKLTAFLGRAPDTATVEDLRRCQLHLVDSGTGPVTINATITGLKFFFDITLSQPELMAKMQHLRVPRTLRVVLSRDEAARLIAAAPKLKHLAALSVAHGAGLRASEVNSLKVGDIDSQRMTLRVEPGKGGKNRYAVLSPVLLERLRAWWRRGHAQGKPLPGGWPFPGPKPMASLSARQLNRAVHVAADTAKIGRPRSASASRLIRMRMRRHRRFEWRIAAGDGAADLGAPVRGRVMCIGALWKAVHRDPSRTLVGLAVLPQSNPRLLEFVLRTPGRRFNLRLQRPLTKKSRPFNFAETMASQQPA